MKFTSYDGMLLGFRVSGIHLAWICGPEEVGPTDACKPGLLPCNTRGIGVHREEVTRNPVTPKALAAAAPLRSRPALLDGTPARLGRRRPQAAPERMRPSSGRALSSGEAAARGWRGRRHGQGGKAYDPPRKGNRLAGVEIARHVWCGMGRSRTTRSIQQ